METVRLDALVAAQFGVTPAEANGLIMEGRIYIDNTPADKAGMPIPPQTVLTLREKARRYASRSGYKLEKALAVFGIDPTDKTACDIGASNGGFTDCLLQHGAAAVSAVDVAYGILAWELRNDRRVQVLERTNARNLTAEQVGGKKDMVTVDVSFISLTKLLPAVDRVLSDDGVCVCLIKPQFEAERRELGKNGTVKDPAILPPLLHRIADAAVQNHLYPAAVTVSPIHGTNGNVEYLMRFDRTPRLSAQALAAAVAAAVDEEPDSDRA